MEECCKFIIIIVTVGTYLCHPSTNKLRVAYTAFTPATYPHNKHVAWAKSLAQDDPWAIEFHGRMRI